jgi:hypothetical protein
MTFFWFLVIGLSKKSFSLPMKISLAFIWSTIYFCNMDFSSEFWKIFHPN